MKRQPATTRYLKRASNIKERDTEREKKERKTTWRKQRKNAGT